MFRWERDNHKLYMQKPEGSYGRTTRMEFATCFGEEICQGLLYERVDLIPSLTQLLKVGFLVGFEEDEVEFLLKTKNLQLFSEDEDFVLGAFPRNYEVNLFKFNKHYFFCLNFHYSIDSYLCCCANIPIMHRMLRTSELNFQWCGPSCTWKL